MGTDISVLAGRGKSGRRVAALLRDAGHTVRAASRSAEVRFDWQDTSTWPAVTEGVGALFLVAPDSPAPLRPFVDRMQEAGVKRVVLLSGRNADEWGDRYGHAMVAAEDVVRSSDLSWTIVRPNNFMQNFTEDVWHAPLLAGRLALPTGGTPEPFVDLDDVAAVAARLLTSDGYGERTFELSGPTALTFGDAVAVIAAAAGRQIRYDELTPDAYVDELRADGVGEGWVTELSSLFEVLRDGINSAPAAGVEQVLGRPPRSFADWVAHVAPTGVWAS